MGGGSRYPGWGILAPTQIYTDMTIKTSKTGRTVVKCSEKQFLCVINKKIQQQQKKMFNVQKEILILIIEMGKN